jgi:hypothetical protein
VLNRRTVACYAVACVSALLGCSGSEEASSPEPTPRWLVDAPLSALPAKLSEVGIYAGSRVSAPLEPAVSYEPGYPLWSDGGQKFRSIVLPEGSHIDASDPQNYVFPLGTLIFKTFAFATPESPDVSVPVETRLLRLSDDGWELSAYGWNDNATDADLLDLKRGQTREVLSDDGALVQHVIPSRLECRQCHESSQSEVLGINELQLAKSGSLSDVAPRLTPAPGPAPLALPAHGPLTTAALGYFVGNCVHCHNGSNGAASSFDLRPDVALANVVDEPTASSATADGIRVVPGEPEQSVLYLGVKGGTELEVKDKPPLGVALRDENALQMLGDWITALGNEQDP